MSHSSSGSVRSIAAPPSPQSTALSSPPSLDHHDPVDPPAPTTSSHLDDIFGSSPPAQSNQHAPSSRGGEEPSDLPSVRRQHVTAGYRDGVSVAKTAHVQRGFDKGFPVGAEIGVRVGIVLGVLEGVVRATPAGEDGAGLNDLYEAAKEELAVQNVFGAVSAEAVGGDGDGQGGQGEDTCGRLGRAGEVVVAKWEDRVKGLLGQTG